MTLMERWYQEVWNEGSEAAIDELFAAHGVAHGLQDTKGNTINDRETFKEYFRSLRSAFTELHVVVEDVMVVGDKAAARCHVRGVHTGNGLGVPASGRPVSFSGMSWARYENGQIVEAWNNFDFMTMTAQIS